MKFDRRRLFAAIAGAASAGAATPSAAREPFAAASVPRSEIDAASLGVRPNADIDQSAMLQSAIDARCSGRIAVAAAARSLSRRRAAIAALCGDRGRHRLDAAYHDCRAVIADGDWQRLCQHRRPRPRRQSRHAARRPRTCASDARPRAPPDRLHDRQCRRQRRDARRDRRGNDRHHRHRRRQSRDLLQRCRRPAHRRQYGAARR